MEFGENIQQESVLGDNQRITILEKAEEAVCKYCM